MIFITMHALTRAKERGLKKPTPRRAFRALRHGRPLGGFSPAYEWRDMVWVFTPDYKVLKTVYKTKENEDD
jgi:hypothetical protein